MQEEQLLITCRNVLQTARDKFYNTIVQSGKIVFDNPSQASTIKST